MVQTGTPCGSYFVQFRLLILSTLTMTVITRTIAPVLFGFLSLFLSLFSFRALIVRSMRIVVIHVVCVVSTNLTVKQLELPKYQSTGLPSRASIEGRGLMCVRY